MKWFGNKPEPEESAQQGALGFDDFEVRLGDLMRGERATMGKSLLDVQRELHIRATYISAIESGDLEAFESPSFVAGYVRSYARYLGMDPDWCYTKFCAETNFALNPDLQKSNRAANAKPMGGQGGDLPSGLLARTQLASAPDPFWRRVDPGAITSIVVLLALIVGLGYGGWTVLKEVQRVSLVPADQPPEVMADLDPVMTGAAPRAISDDVAALRVDSTPSLPDAQGVVRTYRPEAREVPEMVSRDGPIAAINPRVLPVEDDNDGTLTRDAISRAVADAAGADLAPGEVRVLQEGPPTLEVLAVRPSWVRVRAADGTVLFERILDAGERYTVPQSEEPATLRAGNSGSVYLLVNGEPFGPTAPGAQVVDQISLSAAAVSDRFAIADLSDDRDLENFISYAEAAD